MRNIHKFGFKLTPKTHTQKNKNVGMKSKGVNVRCVSSHEFKFGWLDRFLGLNMHFLCFVNDLIIFCK